MKISILHLSKLVAATVTGLGMTFAIAVGASFAQTTPNLPSTLQNDNFDKTGDGGSIYGNDNGNFNPLNLIHQANFGTLDWQEFDSQTNENFKNQVGSFRTKQQQRLLQQPQQQPGNGLNLQPQGNFGFTVPVYTPAKTTPASGN